MGGDLEFADELTLGRRADPAAAPWPEAGFRPAQPLPAQQLHLGQLQRRQLTHDLAEQPISELGVAGQAGPVHVRGDHACLAQRRLSRRRHDLPAPFLTAPSGDNRHRRATVPPRWFSKTCQRRGSNPASSGVLTSSSDGASQLRRGWSHPAGPTPLDPFARRRFHTSGRAPGWPPQIASHRRAASRRRVAVPGDGPDVWWPAAARSPRPRLTCTDRGCRATASASVISTISRGDALAAAGRCRSTAAFPAVAVGAHQRQAATSPIRTVESATTSQSALHTAKNAV